MKKIAVVIFFISIYINGLMAQTDFAKVDELTYKYYTEGAWRDLISVGKQAEKAGIEYYYLSYRMAVAYFQTGNYFSSAKFYEKALKQNNAAYEDSLLIRTLYLSYVYTKQYDKADKIRLFHPDEKIKSTRLTKPLKQIYMESGLSIDENITDKAFKERKLYYYKEIDQFQGMAYWSADLQGFITPRLSYQLGYTGLDIDRYRFYKQGLDTLEQDFTASQSYIFLGLNYNFGRFYVNPAVCLPGYQFESIANIGYDSVFLVNIFDTITTEEKNLLFSMRTGYKFDKLQIGINGSYSDLGGNKQYQAGAELVYFPFGNLHSYLVTHITGQWENQTAYLLFRQKFGLRFTPYLWGELDLKLGNFRNTNLDNGYYVYNVQDAIRAINDFKFIILATRNLEVNLVFQHMIKENFMWSYPTIFDRSFESTNYQFQQFNLIGGLKWTF